MSGSVWWLGGTKVFVMPEGMMKSNGQLVDLIERVKPEIRTLIEKCNTVSPTHTHTHTHDMKDDMLFPVHLFSSDVT